MKQCHCWRVIEQQVVVKTFLQPHKFQVLSWVPEHIVIFQAMEGKDMVHT